METLRQDYQHDTLAVERYHIVDQLYLEAIKLLENIKMNLLKEEIKKSSENISRVLLILSILLAAVDANQEAGQFLIALYTQMIQRLALVPANRDISDVEKAVSYLRHLEALWKDKVLKECRVCCSDSDMKSNNIHMSDTLSRLQ